MADVEIFQMQCADEAHEVRTRDDMALRRRKALTDLMGGKD